VENTHAAVEGAKMPRQPEAIGVGDSQAIKFHDSVKSAPRRAASSSGASSVEKKSGGFFGKIFGK